ncbi:MAG: hypothetical protein LQ349_006616 [Xanthoria aureola]|nr:MAG: hypothetical protein LQ349_006616 [Xanthoria aureola]
MLGKRKPTSRIAPIKKRRKGEPAIEEITFNFDDREEYLTGFHKRKLQRIKHAKEEALKKEREEKVASRKALRENRKADLVKHVEAVNAAVRNAEAKFDTDDASDDEEESFNGLEEQVKVDHEDDYLDEDKHTVVTVEAVDISHEGLQPRQEGSVEEGDGSGATKRADMTPRRPPFGNAETGMKEQRTVQNLKKQPKRKKKFRYESKAERKVTRMKERSGGKAKAKERRGK